MEVHFQRAAELGLLFPSSLVSVEILLSVLFHSKISFGCLGGICVSAVLVLSEGKKKEIYFLVVGFEVFLGKKKSDIHLLVNFQLISFSFGVRVIQCFPKQGH